MIKADVIVGLQWGDEGKGKLIDFFAKKYDAVARFQGGHNGGHSVPRGSTSNNELILILGGGMAISPDRFMDECKKIETFGISLTDRLLISKKAHLVMPSHRFLDEVFEQSRGEMKVGISGEGVGPAFADKANRIGLRVGDIKDHFAEKFATQKALHEQLLRSMHYFTLKDLNEIERHWLDGVEYMKQFQFVDTDRQIYELLKDDRHVLCEGSRGTMLDCDFGIYPYVTACNTVSGAACTGLGIPPTHIGDIYGVMKLYTSRVGFGPMPTELFDSNAKKLRERGLEKECGTSRERRIGWLDLVALKYAIMINGVTKLILTRCDVFEDFDTIKTCVAYKKDAEYIDYYPYAMRGDDIDPVYVEMQGWKQRLSDITNKEDLPDAFLDFVAFLERELGVPVTYVSVGPKSKQIIEM